MSEKIISKPPTPEYEKSWERVFDKRKKLMEIQPTTLYVFPKDYEAALEIIKHT
jgi:hypothetical protein